MVRLLGICVALLGIASLVFGIVFVVMAGSARATALDEITDEAFPMLKYDETAYPYLGLTDAALTEGDIIDTEDDLDAAGDALDEARHKISGGAEGAALFGGFFAPSTIPVVEQLSLVVPGATDIPVDTLVFHEYTAILGFSGVLGMAQMGIGMASLMQIVGIVTIIVGVALMLAGLVVTVKTSS